MAYSLFCSQAWERNPQLPDAVGALSASGFFCEAPSRPSMSDPALYSFVASAATLAGDFLGLLFM